MVPMTTAKILVSSAFVRDPVRLADLAGQHDVQFLVPPRAKRMPPSSRTSTRSTGW